MSSLNLSHLNTLLALPCVIDDNKSLLKCPIIASADQLGNSHFVHTVNPNETLPMFLKRVYNDSNSYEMDCSIYAQLVSNVLSDRWPTDGGNINLYIADDEGAIPLWESKIDEMGYIGVSNKEVADTLGVLPITFKGQWAIRIRDNELLGLTVEGPRIMMMEQWVSDLRTKMEAFATETSVMPSFFEFSPTKIALIAGRNLLDIYFMTNKMNKWGFYSRPGFAAIKANWTSEGIILKYKSPEDKILDTLLELLLNYVKLPDTFDEESTMLVSKHNKICSNCGTVHRPLSLNLPSPFSKSLEFQMISRGNQIPTYGMFDEGLPTYGILDEGLQLAIVNMPKHVKQTNSQLIEARHQQQNHLKQLIEHRRQQQKHLKLVVNNRTT